MKLLPNGVVIVISIELHEISLLIITELNILQLLLQTEYEYEPLL